jgi:hypothetical protein
MDASGSRGFTLKSKSTTVPQLSQGANIQRRVNSDELIFNSYHSQPSKTRRRYPWQSPKKFSNWLPNTATP